MIESGLIDGLKERWLDWKLEDDHETPFQSIDMSQVYLIFGIWGMGITASIFLLFLENLLMNVKSRSRRTRMKRSLPPIDVKTKVLGRRDKPIFIMTKYHR